MIGLGMAVLGYHVSGILYNHDLLIELVSKFDKNTGYQLAIFKHYVLAQDNFDKIYESMNLEYFGKFLSNSALALGYSMASVYSESIDFVSGLLPKNILYTSSKVDEGTSIFNEMYETLENVTDIFVQ